MKRHTYRKKRKARKKNKKLSCWKKNQLKQKKCKPINKNWHGHIRKAKTHVTIFASEFKSMAAMAQSSGNLETGGEVYGYLSHSQQPIILFVAPPSKNAIHQNAMFKQDPIYFKKSALLLFQHFSLDFLGNVHSHHYLPIKTLSKTDVRNLNNIAKKNNFKCLTQFLITFENPSNSANSYSNGKKRAVNLKRITRIKSYIYKDAMNEKPVECRIKVIPGVSPIRQAIESNSELNSDLIVPFKKTKERILYDEYNTVHPRKNRSLPHAIQSRVELFLGKNNLAGNCVIVDDGIVLEIKLFDKLGSLFIIYSLSAPHIIQSVFYKIDAISKKPTNISDDILVNNHALGSLDVVYSLCKRLVIKHVTRNINMKQLYRKQSNSGPILFNDLKFY